MAYDPGLAERLRALLSGRAGLVERAMFGGVAFLVNGNMSVGVWKDALIARLPDNTWEEALRRPGARVFDITGRAMAGWVLVDPPGLASEEALRDWVDESVAFAAALPAKVEGAPKKKMGAKKKA